MPLFFVTYLHLVAHGRALAIVAFLYTPGIFALRLIIIKVKR